jgi:hypothetical protein
MSKENYTQEKKLAYFNRSKKIKLKNQADKKGKKIEIEIKLITRFELV